MGFDGKANFAIAPVIVPPSPAITGLTVTVQAGQGSLFTGTPPYNLTVWEPLPPLGQPTKAFAEIVRVEKVEGDAITFSARAQEGTTAKPIGPGWVIADTITVKALTDIEKAVEEGSTGLASEVTARQAGDSTNATAISNEKTRAEGVEALKATIASLNAETVSRETADNLRLVKAENLKDIASASTARTNLGLGSSAVEPSSAFDPKGAASSAEAAASTALATEKGRAETQEGLKLAKAENLKDVSSASTARTNLGLGTAATEPSTAFDAKGAAASAQTAAEGVTAAEKTRAETAEALKAPLASPALTGSPTAPTQTPGDNSTKLATTAFSAAAVAVEKGRAETAEATKASSAALTSETSAREAGDATNATAISTEKTRAEGQEVLKAPLASPALTGTPTVPTATAGTSTTQVASTAFATNAKGEAESKGTTALGTEKARAETAEAEAVKLTGNQTVAGTKTFSSSPAVPTPAAANDAVSLEFVQSLLEGITPYANVVLATAAALPANIYSAGVLTGVSFGALTIDGVPPSIGQRVLVKNEVTEANNGIYTVTHVGGVAELYALTRASDMAAGATVKTGALTYATAGSTNANKGFWVVGLGPFTVATNPLKWDPYLGSQDIVAGEGINIAGNVVAVSSSVESGSFSGDATGATDIGPALMKAFEEGTLVRLKRGGKYFLNSAVFLDNTTRAKQYVLDATGAEIVYGSGLPSASTLEGLTGTKWAFFNNTLRSALSGGVVTTTAANRATGATVLPPTPRLIIKGGTHNANGNIIGIAFGNGASTRVESATLENIQAGISWSGYVDQNTVINSQTSGSNPVGGQPTRLIYQREAGDGTTVENTKAFGAVHIDAAGCSGLRASSPVSGQFILNNCLGIIEAAHQETDEISSTPYSVFMNRTKLTCIAGRTNASKKTTGATFVIEDAADTLASTLDLIDHTEAFYLRSSPADAADTPRGPTVNIVALNNNGHVRSWGSKMVIIDGWSGSATQYAEGLLLTSSVSGITAALVVGTDQIATGNFDLGYNGTWTVTPPAGLTIPAKSLTAPVFTVAANATGVPGALENGQTYEYIMAAKTSDGRYTLLSTEHTVAAGAEGTNKLSISNPATPCTIAVWRFKGTGSVKTAPDHYIEIPMDGYSGTWYDTGTRINGRLWQTASLLEPNAVKGTTTVTNTTDPAGAIFVTFDRMALTDNAGTLEAGKAQMTLFRHKGGKLTRLNFRSSGTASKGAGHGWAAVVNLRGEVLAVTADQASIAANTTVSLEVSEPLNLAPGLYYAVVLENYAETQATIIASSGAGSTLALLPPISTGQSPTTGLTVPPTVGSTLAVPTTGNGVVPYVWGT